MADTMRWRYGDTNPVVAAGRFDHGDRDWRPGVSRHRRRQAGRRSTTLAATGRRIWRPTRKLFHDAFVGVAMQRSRNGDTQPIRMATAGVFELACAERHVRARHAGWARRQRRRHGAESQQVIAVAAGSPQLAVGRVATPRQPSRHQGVLEIHSTILRDGPQAVANVTEQ